MNYEKCIFKKKSGETINVYEKEIDDIDIFMIEHMIETSQIDTQSLTNSLFRVNFLHKFYRENIYFDRVMSPTIMEYSVFLCSISGFARKKLPPSI